MIPNVLRLSQCCGVPMRMHMCCRARRNCPRAIASTTDNREWQFWSFGRHQSCHFWQSLGYTSVEFVMFKNARFAVVISTLSVTVPGIWVFPGMAAISPFPVVDLCCSHFLMLFRALHACKPRIYRWNFNAISHSFRDKSISGFDGHFRMSVITGIT